MPLTASTLDYVRSEIGDLDPPSDADLNDLYDAYLADGAEDPVTAVIVRIQKGRLANLLNDPASISVSGVYSQSTGENIKALQEQLRRFGVTPDGPVEPVEIIQLERHGRRR